MRILTRLATALLGVVALMILLYTVRPALMPAWEEPAVRYRVLIVSLPMVAFLIALQALRLRTGLPNRSIRASLPLQPQPITTVLTDSEYVVSESGVTKEDDSAPAKPKRKPGVGTALTISILLGVPLAVLMARCAGSFFGPWRLGSRDMISWTASWVALPLASVMAHVMIFRDVLRRKGIEAAMLTAILLTPMITFAISYQACWLWRRFYGE